MFPPDSQNGVSSRDNIYRIMTGDKLFVLKTVTDCHNNCHMCPALFVWYSSVRELKPDSLCRDSNQRSRAHNNSATALLFSIQYSIFTWKLFPHEMDSSPSAGEEENSWTYRWNIYEKYCLLFSRTGFQTIVLNVATTPLHMSQHFKGYLIRKNTKNEFLSVSKRSFDTVVTYIAVMWQANNFSA